MIPIFFSKTRGKCYIQKNWMCDDRRLRFNNFCLENKKVCQPDFLLIKTTYSRFPVSIWLWLASLMVLNLYLEALPSLIIVLKIKYFITYIHLCINNFNDCNPANHKLIGKRWSHRVAICPNWLTVYLRMFTRLFKTFCKTSGLLL